MPTAAQTLLEDQLIANDTQSVISNDSDSSDSDDDNAIDHTESQVVAIDNLAASDVFDIKQENQVEGFITEAEQALEEFSAGDYGSETFARIESLIQRGSILSNDSHPEKSIVSSDGIDLLRWTFNVIEAIEKARHEGIPTNSLTFTHDNFPPQNIELYLQLQTKIAELIPEEHHRPTIVLHVRGKERPYRYEDGHADTPDIALLGGTGPLSDATIMCQLVKESGSKSLFTDHLYLFLTSVPPPRDVERKQSLLGYASHLYNYLKTVYNFVRSEFSHLVMLSNTAHKNAGKILKMMHSPERFLHLVDAIARSLIEKKHEVKKVLVLGTTEAAEANLYPSFLTGLESELPAADLQSELQFFIDEAKAGRASAVGCRFVDLIMNEIKRSQASHVLLSCTEIPLLLHSINPQSGDAKETFHDLLQSRLQQELPKMKIVFVDTEAEMVNHILSHQQKAAGLKSTSAISSDHLDTLTDKTLAPLLQMVLQGIVGRFQEQQPEHVTSPLTVLSRPESPTASIDHRQTDYLMHQLLEPGLDLQKVQSMLRVFFSAYPVNSRIKDGSLRAIILDELIGRPLTEEDRARYSNYITGNQFSCFAREIRIAFNEQLQSLQTPAPAEATSHRRQAMRVVQ